MAKRGRPPQGVALVNRLTGSDAAKERLKAILSSLDGEEGLEDLCRELGVAQTRFADLRTEVLQAALAVLEPRPKGRPPAPAPPPEALELAALRKEYGEVLLDLRAAQIREEIALIAPHLLKRPKQEAPDEEKKSPQPSNACSATTKSTGSASARSSGTSTSSPLTTKSADSRPNNSAANGNVK